MTGIVPAGFMVFVLSKGLTETGPSGIKMLPGA
jgi:hypothetical protein